MSSSQFMTFEVIIVLQYLISKLEIGSNLKMTTEQEMGLWSKVFVGRQEGKVWQFEGIDSGWVEVSKVRIPLKMAQNGTKIIALHPDFCKEK